MARFQVMDYLVDSVVIVTGYRDQYSGALVKALFRFKRHLSNHLVYIRHSAAYDFELFETVHHSLVISIRISRDEHTLMYSQLVQYQYFSV